MSYKLELNQTHQIFKNILLNIKSIFSENSQTIHLARNELKIIELNDINTVVKAFRIPNILNQFVYAYLRKSKAFKAFHNATKLHALQVSTPQAIGYIEFFSMGFLKESFFISKEFKYDFTIAHIRDDQPIYKEKLLQEFASLTYEIHQKGVWHVDYSGGNILITKQENSSYRFSLVDINRMGFFKLSIDDRAKSFSKLWARDDELAIIAKEYAKYFDCPLDFTQQVCFYSNKNKKIKNFKKRLKGKEVND